MDSKNKDPRSGFLDDAALFFFGENFWQGALLDQIKNLNLQQALWRPAENRHCIWEYLRHINYWKEWAILYVKEGTKMNAKEKNWEALPDERSEENWQAEIQKTKIMHEHFMTVAESIGDDIYFSGEENVVWFRQVLFHDCYHTGQIGLLRALQGISSVT